MYVFIVNLTHCKSIFTINFEQGHIQIDSLFATPEFSKTQIGYMP